MQLRTIVKFLIWAGISLHVFSMISELNFPPSTVHGYGNAFAESFSDDLVFLALPVVPYVICLLILRKVANVVLVLPAVIGALAMDVDTYFAVKSSVSSTAAIGLVAAPVFNLFIIIPVGFLIGWLLSRYGPLKTRQS